jgi:hypothetical protein
VLKNIAGIFERGKKNHLVVQKKPQTQQARSHLATKYYG